MMAAIMAEQIARSKRLEEAEQLKRLQRLEELERLKQQTIDAQQRSKVCYFPTIKNFKAPRTKSPGPRIPEFGLIFKKYLIYIFRPQLPPVLQRLPHLNRLSLVSKQP